MPLCTCTHCKALTNGIGKEIHRTTVIRHMKKEQEEQELENAYQSLHSEENYFEENEENEEENSYEERSSPMEISEISDNEEILIEEENLTTLHNDEASMEILSSFQDEDEEIDDYYHESDDLNHYDSQSELEFDTSDDKEDNTTFSNELFEGLRLLYVKSNFNFSEAAFNNIYKAFNRNKISFNKVKRKLGSIVGIEPKIYDINGKARKNLPFISIIEHLKLQFKNPERSKELLYRHNYTCNKGEFAHNNIGDIFDGQIYQELLNDEYFLDPRDIAFTASCDGYQIFRQKTDDCWVFLFLNNNLPQELRVKKENLMVTLIIPGPKQPQDFNSFLYPLIQEIKSLQDGISCYDGNKEEQFTLRAHILAWTGNIPALSKVLCLTGHNSYSGCRFCNLRGTLNETNRHVYYPLQQNIDPKRLPIRTHDEILNSTNQIERLEGDRRETYIRDCGIKGKSILFDRYNAPFFRNVAPHMFRHWIGKFYPKNNEWNSNEYTISFKTWVEIGEIMERSRSHMPPDIGRPPRNIVKHSAGFKAVEWANWIILFSLPLLKGRLPQSNLLGWSRFVEAVKLCIQPLIEFEELDLIRNLLIEFYNHYANSYGVGGERLLAFLISFHYLLHVIDSIEDFSPCRGFWQFPMERFCGMLILLVSSRKLPYVNLFNNVLMQERFKYLQLLPIYNEKDIKENYAKYGKLRTKDGNIISSKWWKKENDSSRNDFCVAINLTVDLQERNYRAPLNLREEEIFGQIEYFMVHEFQNQER
ncbi:transposase domain-containing protein [Rhizophagus irregularis DAOM 181602=DAOM 197198]|nr:transposase domain-containing protein [Rhizophagus irregularis DAOM 181602=DAOM 197198]